MFKKFRLQRLELQRERLIVRVAALAAIVRGFEGNADRWRWHWVEAREDLGVIERRIKMLKT